MSEESTSLSGLGEPISTIAKGVAKAAAGGIFSGIQESTTELWAALIGDRLKLWRVRNLSDSLEKTARHIQKKGIDLADAKPLPYGDMLALFDGMSKADDENLSDIWARLLAEAMTTDERSAIPLKTAAAVLDQMSADAAKVFLALAKEEKISQLNETISRIRNQSFFPLSDAEKSLNDADLKHELDSLLPKVEGQWDAVFDRGSRSDGYVNILKDELLRLNLVEPKDSAIEFDDRPFDRGYQVNAEGLDSVLSDLHERIKDLINDRTNHGRRPFFKDAGGYLSTNFTLNNLGKEIARKLDLL